MNADPPRYGGTMSVRKYLLATAAGAAGITLLRKTGAVHRQNSKFRRYWEGHLVATLDDLNARSEAGKDLPLIYVALGDSAAQGLGATVITEGYVPRVAQALSTGSGREVALLNLSLSGGTVQSMLGTQLPQLAGLRIGGEPVRPDVVTIDIGSNDVGHAWVTNETFAADVRRLVESLPEGTFMLNIPSFGRLPTEERAAAFSQILDEEATRAGHHPVNIRTISQAMPERTYLFDYHAPDLFHPNSPWYAVWAQQFVDAITNVHGWAPIDVATLAEWSGPIPTDRDLKSSPFAHWS